MKDSDTYMLLRLPEFVRDKIRLCQEDWLRHTGTRQTPGEAVLKLIDLAFWYMEKAEEDGK